MNPPPNERKARLRALLLRTVDELVELLVDDATPEATVYSTANGGALPPGRSRRWLRDHAREIPGHVRVGGARGRSVEWRVPREAYDAWVAHRDAKPSNVVHVDEAAWITESGHRLTRRSA